MGYTMVRRYLFVGILLLCVVISPSAQPTIGAPRICHDENDKLRCFDDGMNHIEFFRNKFMRFESTDSSLAFIEEGRQFLVYNRELNDNPVSIYLSTAGIALGFIDSVVLYENQGRSEFRLNDVLFRCDSINRIQSEILFEVNSRKVKLEFWYLESEDRFFWHHIEISDKASVFGISYNCFHYSGPQFISCQDSLTRCGWTISGRFRTNKSIWMVQSSYIDKDENSSIGYFGEDYYYEYNMAGRLRNRRSYGVIEDCLCNYSGL
jgi:hypothetical protein